MSLHIASSNILRRRKQACFSIIISSIAIFITLLISSVLFQIKEGIRLSRDRVGADVMIIANANDFGDTSLLYSAKPLKDYIPKEDVRFLEEFDSQIAAMSEQFFTHTLMDGCCSINETIRIVGIDSETDFIIKPWLEQNHLENLGDATAIVGSDVMYPLGDRVVLLGQAFHVAGTLYRTGTGMDKTIFIPIHMARALAKEKFPFPPLPNRNPDELISSIFIKLEPGVDPAGFSRMVNAHQLKVAATAKADTMSKLEDSIQGWIRIVLFLTASIVLISFLSLFGRFISLMKERKKEIGYLRSLGYSSGTVFWISLLEIGMMSAAGGLIAGFSALISIKPVLHYVSEQFTLPRSDLSPVFLITLFLAGPVLALALGLLSSLIPSLKSAGLEPKDAMTTGEI